MSLFQINLTEQDQTQQQQQKNSILIKKNSESHLFYSKQISNQPIRRKLKSPMQRQTEIIDLTDFSKEEILQRIQEILDSSYIQKFTLLLKRDVHQSRTEKKLQKKQTAIENMKHKYSTTTNNLFAEKDTNAQHKVRPTGENSPALKITSSYVRGHDKKFTRVSSNRSRDVSKINQSVYGPSTKIEELPKSLQLYYEGEYQLALIQFFDEEKQLKKKLTQPAESRDQQLYASQYAKLMINIGNCYFCEKDYDKAIKFYRKEIQSSTVDQKLIGQKYNNLGSCYAYIKQNQQALKAFNQALKIYAKYPQLDCSNLLKNIGIIYFRSGMYSSAETYFEQSINQRKAKSPENEEALLSTYFKLGLCQKCTAKPQEAVNNLLFSLNISEKGYPLHNEILKQLAEIYQSQEKFSQALLYYEKLSDQFQRKVLCQGEIYEKVAKIHQRQGNFVEHDKFMRLALGEYRKFNHERKMSQLSNPKYEIN